MGLIHWKAARVFRAISLASRRTLDSHCLLMLICDEENMILAFLNSNTEAFYGAGEICRKAGNRKMVAKNPRWALPFLISLKDKDLVEADANGHFRVKLDRREKEE